MPPVFSGVHCGYLAAGCRVGGRMARFVRLVVFAALSAFLSFGDPPDAFAYGTGGSTQKTTAQCRVNVAGNGLYYTAWEDYPAATTPPCSMHDPDVLAFLKSKFDSTGQSCGFSPNFGTSTSTFTVLSSGSYQKDNYCSAGSGSHSYTTWARTVETRNNTTTSCVDGATNISGSCICNVGFAPDSSGKCVPSTCPSSGTLIPGTENSTFALSSLSSSNVACVSGCMVTGSMSVSYTDSSGVKHSQLAGPIRSTGQACNPEGQGGTLPSLGAAQPGQPPASAPATCPIGQCPGTVNGVAVCAACGTVSSGNVTTGGGTNSGGTITTTDCTGGTCVTKVGTVGPDGSITWTTYTNGSGNSASDTPAGGNGSSGNGSGDSQNQDQQSFCAENPDSIICKSSSWGGTCGSFTCSGDSVQCAIAKDQHDRNCQLFDNQTDISNKGVAAVAAGASGVSSVGVSDVSLDFASKLDQQDRLPGACPGDRVVPVYKGTSITIPFSKVCELAGSLSKALIAFSMLAAAFIVFRQRA